jgi:predicted AlkP superfamily phosphohydrolase/phosphomutase
MDMRTKEKVLIDALDELERRFRIAKELFREKPDFFFLLLSETDHVQHALFSQMESIGKSPRKKEILEFYRKVDDCLGWFLDNIDESTYLVIMSDHGFRSYRYTFSANSFLESKGLLKYKKASAKKSDVKSDSRLVLDINPAVGALASHNIGRRALDFARWSYVRFQNITGISKKVRLKAQAPLVADPEKSKASGSAHGFIYLNRKDRFENGPLDEDEAGKLKERLIRMLREERSPFTGRPALSIVGAADKLYQGNCLKDAPDIVLWSDDHMITGGSFGSPFRKDERNFHDMNGIFAITGPGIRAGQRPEKHITDIAPTILHLLGLAVPSHMDGKVIDDAFEEGSLGDVKISQGTARLREKIQKLKKKARKPATGIRSGQ